MTNYVLRIIEKFWLEMIQDVMQPIAQNWPNSKEPEISKASFYQ